MSDKTLLRIGGACSLVLIVLMTIGYGYASTRPEAFVANSIFDLEPGEALPIISQYTREWQLMLGGQIVGELILIPFWLAPYQALKASRGAYAALGAAAGILSIVMEVVMGLPGAAMLRTLGQSYSAATDEASRMAVFALYYAVSGRGQGVLLTALRTPRVGFTSLAMLRGDAFARRLAWLGIATASLTLVELALWALRGSPNDPLPVGGVAAVMGILWTVLTGIWLLRLQQWHAGARGGFYEEVSGGNTVAVKE